MSSLNKVHLIGRLGQDPDVRYSQSNTAIANLSVATSDKYKDKSGEWQERTEWHRVVFFGRTAEVCQEYLQKGSLIYVEGSLQTRKWTDKEDRERYTTEVKGYKMQMLDSKSNTPSKAPNDRGNNPPENDPFNENDIDDDLPF